MANSSTTDLSNAGVSIWLDDLSRERIESGSLASYIEKYNVVGVTTNPTIFSNAIRAGKGYAAQIERSAAQGLSAHDTVFDLMCADVADACDVFNDVFHRTNGRDGRVSIEVSPDLARDTAGTVQQAKQLWQKVNRPNAMIKIPATEEGLEAISQTIGAGISVNVTLIFSLTRYRQVLNAYLVGLERAKAAGHNLSDIHSVASFFVSRVDTLIDPQLDKINTPESSSIRAKSGLSNARLAYEAYQQGFSSERAKALLAAGANPQRPLWASTGVKDPTLPDTLYVAGLVAEGVVNTIPDATLLAFADHGEVTGDTVTGEYRDSDQILNELDALGIDYSTLMQQLETEGLQKFEDSWRELLEAVTLSLEGSR